MDYPPYFLDLPNSTPEEAEVILLPLPFGRSTSYGVGTELAPEAIWQASTQVETFDPEFCLRLDDLKIHNAIPVRPTHPYSNDGYLDLVEYHADKLHKHPGFLIGVGGDHSITPSLVFAVNKSQELSDLIVIQLDAHLDLRKEYNGTRLSHACSMWRLVEHGAHLINIGWRTASAEEYNYLKENPGVSAFSSGPLAEPIKSGILQRTITEMSGKIYITIDVDVLEVHLCPSTGTPQPGGLDWWAFLQLLHLIIRNKRCEIIGIDVVETVPSKLTIVNEFVAAKIITKILAYLMVSERLLT